MLDHKKGKLKLCSRIIDLTLWFKLSGSRTQGGAKCDGRGGPDLPADLSALHSCGADAGQDVPLGRLPPPSVEKTRCQTTIPPTLPLYW